MNKELIDDIVDSQIIGAVEGITEGLVGLINDKLNLAYEQIRRDISEKYHCATNRPKEVGVNDFLQFLIDELKRKAPTSSSGERPYRKKLYRSGYFDAIKEIEKIIGGNNG